MHETSQNHFSNAVFTEGCASVTCFWYWNESTEAPDSKAPGKKHYLAREVIFIFNKLLKIDGVLLGWGAEWDNNGSAEL